jgi:hypothetical protein
VVGKGRLRQIVDYRHRMDARARVQFAGDLDRIPGLNGSLVSGIEAAARVADRFSDRITEHTV